MSRDWSATLWPASYKGVPFFTKVEGRQGKRRIVVHEFPMRDDPFNEDLGSGARHWPVTVYLASDTAELDTAALEAACDSAGPGILVLPFLGPVQARALDWDFNADKDELGHIAGKVTFVREGASSALASVDSMAAALFGATGQLGDVGSMLVGTIAVTRLGGQVTAAAISGFQDAVAGVEIVRASYNVDLAVSATVRDDLTDLYAQAAVGINRLTGVDVTLGAGLIEAARSLGDGMDPTDAAIAFGGLADAPIVDPGEPLGPTAWSPSRPTRAQQALAQNAARNSRLARLAALTAYAEALVRQTYPSRREGIAARALAAERFDAALAEASGAENLDLFRALADLQGRLAEWLSAIITNLAPVVTVTVPTRLPSVLLAYVLYQDPTRAAELEARNGATHPGFMPTTFEALAS